MRGPGFESGATLEATVADGDAIRLVRRGRIVTGFVHTAAGWTAFAEQTFTSAPFAGTTVSIGVATTAEPASALGRFKLTAEGGMVLVVR